MPLDPAYPAERLAFMLEDAGRARSLLTQAALVPRAAGARGPPDRLPRRRRAPRRSAGEPGDPRGPRPDGLGLRHLHLGLDRPAQGCARSRHGDVGRLLAGDRGTGSASGRTTSGRCSTPRLRLLGLGDLGRARSTAAGWWWCRTGGRSADAFRRAAGARGGDRAQPDAVGVPPARAARGGRGRPRLGAALRDLRRRGAGPARALRALVRAPRRRERRAGQHVRHHRDHGPRRPGAGSAGDVARRRAGARSAGRSPTRGSTCSTARCEPVPVGRAGRALRRRRRPGARLPRPAGADRRAVRPRSVLAAGRARGCTARGDLARRLPDGELEYLGPHRPPGEDPRLPHRARGDRGGARRATRACARRVVLARADAAGGPAPGRLRGARGEGDALPRSASCASFLAGARCRTTWCRPRSWLLDALPLTRNGKVDRRALPRAGRGRDGGARRVAPRTPVEELLAGIWRRGAGRRAGRGATTTSSTSAATRCSPPSSSRGCASAFGVELPLRARLRGADRRGPRPGGSRTLRAGASRRRPSRRVPARRGARRSPSPSSGSGSSTSSSRGARPTTSPAALRLDGRRSTVPALARPPSARSCGATRRCAPRFRERRRTAGPGDRARGAAWRCRLVDLAGLPERGARGGAGAADGEEARAAVRPGAGAAAARAPAAARGREHAAAARPSTTSSRDGWSMGVLVRELAALYRRCRAGRALAAARAAGPVRRLRGLAARLAGGRGPRGAARLVARALAGLPRARSTCRPTGRGRPCRAAAAAARRWRCPPALSRGPPGARPRGRERRSFMALLAAFQALLSPLLAAGGRGGGLARSRAATGWRPRG